MTGQSTSFYLRLFLLLVGAAVLILPSALAANPPQQGIQCKKVLGVEDVTNLLKAGVVEERLKQLVTTCKVDFELTDTQERQLRSLGATDSLLFAITRNYQPPEPPTVTLEADKTEIKKGESVMLSWISSHADEVTLEPGLGKVEPSGSKTVSPQRTTRYRLVARGPGGETERTLTVSVVTLNPNYQLEHTLTAHSNDIRSVAFSPDGRLLASGSDDDTIKLWNPQSGRLVRTLTQGNESMLTSFNSVAFSPDGRLLASSNFVQIIVLWKVSTGSWHRTLKGHSNWIWSIAFSPDGRLLASSSRDKTIKLWDPQSGRLLRTTDDKKGWGRQRSMKSVAFSPDGSILASGSDDDIKLWEVSTGSWHRSLKGHDDSVRSLAFSPNGRLLASGSEDDTVRLWDVFTGRELRTLKGHKSDVESVAISPDGLLLASGSRDHTIKLWEVSTGKLLRTLKGHGDDVNSVAFSPDGKLLASGSDDDTVKLWRRVDQ